MAHSDVTRLIGELKASYPRVDIGAATIAVYCQRLEGIPIAELRAAVAVCIDCCTFFPSIAEIRQAWAAAKAGPKRSGMDAWADVLAQVKAVGYMGTPTFSDPAVAQAVKTFGWREICESTETMADRAHFAKAYDSITTRNLEAVALGRAGLRPELPAPAAPKQLAAPAQAEPADIASTVRTLIDSLTDEGDSL